MDHAPTRRGETTARSRRFYLRVAENLLLRELRHEAELYEVSAPLDPAGPEAGPSGASGAQRPGVRAPRALGPFRLIDANEVARMAGRTRGAVSNLFGSQVGLQEAAMHVALDSGRGDDSVFDVVYPDPAAHEDLGAWVRAVADVERARGPHFGREPQGYASRWVLWLALVPYQLWSSRLARATVDETDVWVDHLAAEVVGPALAHFDVAPVEPFTLGDLVQAHVAFVEGLWLGQASYAPPYRPGETPRDLARQGLWLLYRGAVTTR